MPSYAALLPVRALSDAGRGRVHAAGGGGDRRAGAAASERGRAITFIFLGWSLASVLGMPAAQPTSARPSAGAGPSRWWRVLAPAAARGVWRALPDGVRPPALSLRRLGARP